MVPTQKNSVEAAIPDVVMSKGRTLALSNVQEIADEK